MKNLLFLIKKYLRCIFFFCLVFLFLFALERFCHFATDGFALVNIYPPKQDRLNFEAPLSSELKKKITSQPFYYFNSGSQSYVFLSEDQQIILKFFKFQHMRIPPILESFYLPSFLDKKRKEKRKKKKALLIKTLKSYQIAFDKMKEECGLLFIHLGPTQTLKSKIVIYDKIGKRHLIDLDEVEFVLQKKATLIYPTLKRWMTKKEIDKAKRGIRRLLHLVLFRCQQGIFDKDPDFSTNFGFVEDNPIQIDVGRFSLDEKEKKATVYGNEMIRIIHHFKKWIQENYPELMPCLKKELASIYSSQ